MCIGLSILCFHRMAWIYSSYSDCLHHVDIILDALCIVLGAISLTYLHCQNFVLVTGLILLHSQFRCSGCGIFCQNCLVLPELCCQFDSTVLARTAALAAVLAARTGQFWLLFWQPELASSGCCSGCQI